MNSSVKREILNVMAICKPSAFTVEEKIVSYLSFRLDHVAGAAHCKRNEFRLLQGFFMRMNTYALLLDFPILIFKYG